MSSLTLKARDASAEAFFAIDDDLVLSQPATFGTTTHFLRQSIVPIVAHVQGENVLRCLGTGFFISCSGLLVTAAHVVTDPIERQYGGLNELDGLTWHTDELHLGVLLTTGANTLDEPTSVLTPQEADEVLRMLREMTLARRISVLMITHKFREVTAYCDRVTVLRRGRMAGTGSVREVDTSTMARWMVGEAAAPAAPNIANGSAMVSTTNPPAARSGQLALELIELRADDDLGMPALDGLSLQVHAGELVGLAGVSGNGQTYLLDAVSGQRRLRDGRILVHGKPYQPTRRQAEERGVRTLPEEPLRNGGVARMSVVENLALRTFDRTPMSNRWGWLKPAVLRDQGLALIDEYRVRAPSPEAPLEALSGGNVQRVVLARELSGPVRVLVVANPCFGLDFLTAAQIRDELRAQRDRGVAVLLISEDLDEILALSDRIAVISGGRIVLEAEVGKTDRTTVGAAMAAHGNRVVAAETA